MVRFLTLSLILCAQPMIAVSSEQKTGITADGTLHLPAFDLPESSFLSQETRAALKRERDVYSKEDTANACPSFEGAAHKDIPSIRQCLADAFYKTSSYQTMMTHYPVNMTPEIIGGVYTEVFTPIKGVAPKNRDRVLINLHAGALMWGSRTLSHLESIPIASVGNIKVISVDYRMGPEFVFPAASEDVASVYRELLKDYKPENIGIYGNSGGAMLVAQAMAWFQQENIPLPGAVGMFFSGAPTAFDGDRYKWGKSDSAYVTEAIREARSPGTGFGIWERLFGPGHTYFKGLQRGGPLDSPGSYDNIMAKFPPTLLINGGLRDFSLSMVMVTHAQLVRLGVEADLHIWEGMSHIFQNNPEFPESREAYNVTVKFFDTHLGDELQ
ncbi:alpha/beta hydrolase [Sedimenticola sp.]|uniref:alpha/beta hydrolase n=1 Tax=Sedimenticola sp. TaxID=1940285 RepID=UPI003D1527A5